MFCAENTPVNTGGTPLMFQVNEICPALLVVAASQTKLLIWLAVGPPVGGAWRPSPPTPFPVADFTVTVPE